MPGRDVNATQQTLGLVHCEAPALSGQVMPGCDVTPLQKSMAMVHCEGPALSGQVLPGCGLATAAGSRQPIAAQAWLPNSSRRVALDYHGM